MWNGVGLVWFGFPKRGFKKKTKAISCLVYAGLVTYYSTKDNPKEEGLLWKYDVAQP